MGGALRFCCLRFPTHFFAHGIRKGIKSTESSRIVPKMNMAQGVLCNCHILVFMVLQHTVRVCTAEYVFLKNLKLSQVMHRSNMHYILVAILLKFILQYTSQDLIYYRKD